MKLTEKMKVVVRDYFGREFEGKIVSVNSYRPPDLKYAVDIGFDDYVFVGEESIRPVEEANNENN